jgi:hypothetical protein
LGKIVIRDLSHLHKNTREEEEEEDEDAREDDDGKQKRRGVVVGAPLFTRGTFAAF